MLYAIRHHACRHVAGLADGLGEARGLAGQMNHAPGGEWEPGGDWVVNLLESETQVNEAIRGLVHGIRCGSCEVPA